MPHCVIEYSKSLEAKLTPQALVAAVHLGAQNSELFESNAIKSRALAYEHFRTGDQPVDFVHATVKILSGRSQSQRKALADAVMLELKKLGQSAISLTVEVRDMERESYAKALVTD